MGFLPVLLAIGFALRGICAITNAAFVLRSIRPVLVVPMTLTLFFGWPAKVMVFALFIRALPGTIVGFLVLCQIGWSFEGFVA